MAAPRSIVLTCTIAVAVAVACTRRETPKRSALDDLADRLDPAVFQIAPALALLGDGVIAAKRAVCATAATLAEAQRKAAITTAAPQPASELDRLIDDVLSGREEKAICEALTLADDERAAVFAAVKQARAVPAGLYVLSTFEPGGGDPDDGEATYTETEIGPIRTLETCEKIEKVLRDAAVPTRACRAWKPPEPSDLK